MTDDVAALVNEIERSGLLLFDRTLVRVDAWEAPSGADLLLADALRRTGRSTEVDEIEGRLDAIGDGLPLYEFYRFGID
jgi:hypothetical protein